MPDNSFDPRPAHLSGPNERNVGSGPEAWAGSGDHPDTRAEPVPAIVQIRPREWKRDLFVLGTLITQMQMVTAVDFYRGRP